MRLSAALLLFSVITSFVVSGQEPHHPADTDLLARLSYQNSATSRNTGERRLCLAVFRDGEYRILRSRNDSPMERLHGKMPPEQLKQLKTLLAAEDFRSQIGNHGSGLVRRDSEQFAAEILHGANRTERFHWLNPDGESPFPPAIVRVVGWLKGFQPANANPFDYLEYPDVCPPVGLRRLQPSVATNERP